MAMAFSAKKKKNQQTTLSHNWTKTEPHEYKTLG